MFVWMSDYQLFCWLSFWIQCVVFKVLIKESKLLSLNRKNYSLASIGSRIVKLLYRTILRKVLLLPNGDKGIWTLDPLLARQVLSQLSYTPMTSENQKIIYIKFSSFHKEMGLNGLEPSTSRLSGVRSNQLSYKPIESGSHLLSHIVSNAVLSAA